MSVLLIHRYYIAMVYLNCFPCFVLTYLVDKALLYSKKYGMNSACLTRYPGNQVWRTFYASNLSLLNSTRKVFAC